MKVVSVVSRKGGAGKSTVTAHLGVWASTQGADVLLVDTDPQRSLAAWYRTRKPDTPILAETEVEGLATVIDAAREAGMDRVYVDSGPHADGDAQLAAKYADLAVIVCRPAVFDLRAVAGTVEAIRKANVSGVILLNAAPVKRGSYEPSIVVEARKALAAYELPVLKTSLRYRSAYQMALIDGRSVNELDPKSAAAAEIKILFDEVEGYLA